MYERIMAPDNLREAFFKVQKGKGGRKDIEAYRENLEENISFLYHSLQKETYRTGIYNTFRIYDPKERLISAASVSDRIVHHAIINICGDIFERYQVPFSYACRKGKGTFAAIERAHCNMGRYAWYLKLDVRKYFDNIHHEVLVAFLRRIFKDKRLLWLLQTIVQSYAVTPCRGIPIGNLTSQYFANLYLSYADRYLLHDLRIPAYIRYMDDMLLWSDDRNELLEKGAALERFVVDNLRLQLKPFVLNRCPHGLPALGFVIFPGQVRMNGRSKRRFERKMRENCLLYAAGGIDQVQFAAKMEALYAFVRHGCWHAVASRQMEKLRAEVDVEL
ncbi:MAG: RNA-directed DNA polymerase [Bacteroides sp.]|nr:RNA-directed DNA polymerase [Bacteroides sp.]